MMSKFGIVIIIIFVLLGSLSGYFVFTKEQNDTKIYQIGILGGGGSFTDIGEGFMAKMTELGYIEGKNIEYNWQDAGFDYATQFVDDKVDLIFTSGSTPAALEAKAATNGTDIPVVFAYAATEGSNLINNVREPGGIITGVRYPGHEMMTKRLEILLEIAPDIDRVW
ncbi:MAG: ABC transporter substrate binding protein, partial [Candidatus Thorarchaeota archaeon]